MTKPDLPAIRISPAPRATSAFPPEPEALTQFAGVATLDALAATQPLEVAAAETLTRRRYVRETAGRRFTARIWEQRVRLAIFALNGTAVFAAGLMIQIILVRYAGMGHIPSYIAQTVASVQVNFLLSRYLTWRDRDVTFLPALARFNLQQLAGTGLGIAGYVGLDRLGMNYVAATVAVTAVLTPVSFLSSHKWPMGERMHLRWRVTALPWPLFAVLAVQAALAMRLVWSNTAFIDEASYLYAGGQELNHWIHGTPVFEYQMYFSGSPAIYPPFGAIANAIGGLVAARILGLCFMLGSTTLLYLTAQRLAGRKAALLGSALFAALGTTQFLSGFATYDPMALFLLVLAAYLAIGWRNAHGTLAGAASLTVIAPTVLALANATKYATALWDPVVIGLVACAPVLDGRSWRDGCSQAARFAAVLGCVLGAGLAVGKGKYIAGILYTTVDRSSSQVGMGQSPLEVLQAAWAWIGVVLVAAAVGMILLFASRHRSVGMLVVGALLMLATVAAPLNQARIGTTVSLQKHVVFGAWFGCILAGYGLDRLLRYRVLVGAAALALVTALSAYYTHQASAFYGSWRPENMAFIAGLRPLVHPGSDRYLIEGYDDIPAYYIGPSVSSIQWKEAGSYSYTDPQTGSYKGDQAFADAIRRRVFTLIILNYQEPQDYAIADDIARYGGYRVAGHLPPSTVGANSTYTVWRVTGAQS
jgi:putative flippase GtrA